MTLSDLCTQIERHFNYWIANYKRTERTNNNARKTGEAIAKAIIIKKRGEVAGTKIILGNDVLPTRNRKSRPGTQLSFADLIQVLREIHVFSGKESSKDQMFELLRKSSNNGSHSVNSINEEITNGDMEMCKTVCDQLVGWLYKEILNCDLPQSVQDNLNNKVDSTLYDEAEDRFSRFENACWNFDVKKFQYILVSPEKIFGGRLPVESLIKLPWRLVIDFNPRSDIEENGLLHNFNRIIGTGYKRTFTRENRIEFDADFKHYWYMANGQGELQIDEFQKWKNANRSYLGDILFKKLVEGSRIRQRIVVMVDIDPRYAQFIITEFNRIDHEKLHFVLCSENHNYENILDNEDNVTVVEISSIDIANGIVSSANYRENDSEISRFLIPYFFEGKKSFIDVSKDHFDFLESLGIEVVYKDIENSIDSDPNFEFYKGGIITWMDLAEGKDIARHSFDLISKRLQKKLEDNRLDTITLFHDAGAGGTTLGRRLAYNFSKEYPTVILRKYYHRKTIDGLRILYDQYAKGTLPFLIIVESFEVKEVDILYRDLSSAKKNAVIFVVHRSSTTISSGNSKFTLKGQLEGNELRAFPMMFSLVASDRKNLIERIQEDYKYEPRYISPILYGLTAFGKDFKGLEQYVLKGLDGITIEQRKFIGFVSIIYFYTQKSVPAELFSVLFKVLPSECDLVSLLGVDSPLLELLHEDGDAEGNFNRWRPRYAIVGEEIMQIILGGEGDAKRNWKNGLSGWLVDLIQHVKLNLAFLDDETKDMFNSLFIERTVIEEDGNGRDFTRAILDLPTPNDGLVLFEALTEAYPDDAHFHGHFARYLYSDKIGLKQYDRAIDEVNQSLNIFPDNSSLLHTLGMCYREKVEYLIENSDQSALTIEEIEDEVKLLAEMAIEAFDNCIEADQTNLYGYESQIKTILNVIRFGAEAHGVTSNESFITNPQYSWYSERLDKVSNLLEEALFVLEQSKNLEQKERVSRSAGFIYACEGLFYRTLGKHLQARNKFESLVKSTPGGYAYMRPYYRRMYVISLLASKSKNPNDIFQSWKNINENELNNCIQLLSENIFEDPTNTQNIRLWLQATRHLKNPVSISSCIAKIGAWTQIAKQSTNRLLEGYYYLYVLNAISAISSGSTIADPAAIQSVKDILEKVKPMVKNEKFCYEWYGKGDGVKKMVSHKELGDYSSEFFKNNKDKLEIVTGRIKNIDGSQKGIVLLDCGLEAFFVPNVGGFTERDTNNRIKCYVGFRYDQMQAWAVESLESGKRSDESLISEMHEFIESNEADIEDEKNVEKIETLKSVSESFHAEVPQLSGLKIVDKINPSKRLQKNNAEAKSLKEKPLKEKTYTGIVKKRLQNGGVVQVDELDKDVVFAPRHLVKCNISQLRVGKGVKLKISFLDESPLMDKTERNYIVSSISLIS